MPDLSTDNPVAVVLVVLLILLLGGASGGFIRGVIADRRAKRLDDTVLLDMVRDLVREEMAHQAARHREEMDHVTDLLRTERRRGTRLERRVDQLTEVLRDNGLAVPDWPPTTPDHPTT